MKLYSVSRWNIRSCHACSECKPQYYQPEPMHFTKATQPFERLNIDFKGPLPNTNQNRFMLTICDEYSRFPFAYFCRDVSANTVVMHLSELFSIFGMPAYIHSDRGSAFMSCELKQFLGNGQVERLNRTLWQAITLALKTHKLPTICWQDILPDALHSIRTLLCTPINETPHERLFNFQRRSTTGSSIPSWLATPGPVLPKRHVKTSKFDPLVDGNLGNPVFWPWTFSESLASKVVSSPLPLTMVTISLVQIGPKPRRGHNRFKSCDKFFCVKICLFKAAAFFQLSQYSAFLLLHNTSFCWKLKLYTEYITFDFQMEAK